MEFVGKEMIHSFFESIKSSQNFSNFVIVHGPSDIGKSEIIKSMSQELLGLYAAQDFLYIKDLSSYLGKTHNIKVSVDIKEQIVDIPGIGRFVDYGTREMQDWLTKSSFGKYKILFIENIERMGISAANAFLKTLEEPLSNKIIIATSSNLGQVMDTILSRAFLIRFDNSLGGDISSEMSSRYPDLDNNVIRDVIYLSGNKIMLAEKIIHNESFNMIIENFQTFISLMDKDGYYATKFKILTSIQKMGLLDEFLDGVIYYLMSNSMYDKITKILQIKGMLQTNVGVDNVLFYMTI